MLALAFAELDGYLYRGSDDKCFLKGADMLADSCFSVSVRASSATGWLASLRSLINEQICKI